MSVYRLDPIDLAHLRWKVSSIRETVWAAADSPEQARALVGAKTMLAIDAGPASVKLTSPWLDDRLTSCVCEPSRTEVPSGAVVDTKGRDVAQR
jgi:hypothetical protein